MLCPRIAVTCFKRFRHTDKEDSQHHQRRRLQAVVQELRGNIRVLCRIRPVSCSGAAHAVDVSGQSADCAQQQPGTVRVLGPTAPYGVALELSAPASAGRLSVAALQGKGRQEARDAWKFVFDGVLDAASSQAEVFDEVRTKNTHARTHTNTHEHTHTHTHTHEEVRRPYRRTATPRVHLVT